MHATLEYEDLLFDNYRRAIEARERLNAQAEQLRISAERLRQADYREQAALTLDRAERLQEEAHGNSELAEGAQRLATVNLAKRLKTERKREAALAQADAARVQQLRGLEARLEADPRTAGGSRVIVVGNARGKSEKRVSLGFYGSLIRNPRERTEERIAAMQIFDALWHRSEKGAFPEPRFEPPVDTSAGPAGVSTDRIAAVREMDQLRRRIGEFFQALLVHRVVDRLAFIAMARMGFGDERSLATLFLAAVDAVAAHYALTAIQPAVEALNERLDRPPAAASLETTRQAAG